MTRECLLCSWECVWAFLAPGYLEGMGEDRCGWIELGQAGPFFTWQGLFLSFCKNYLPPSLQLPHSNWHFSGAEQNLATQNLCKKKIFLICKFRVSDGKQRLWSQQEFIFSYLNEFLFLPSWNVTWHFELLLNLWVYSETSESSGESKHSPVLGKRRNGCCVASRLSCLEDKNQWT